MRRKGFFYRFLSYFDQLPWAGFRTLKGTDFPPTELGNISYYICRSFSFNGIRFYDGKTNHALTGGKSAV
jgi:hypothetical protein